MFLDLVESLGVFSKLRIVAGEVSIREQLLVLGQLPIGEDQLDPFPQIAGFALRVVGLTEGVITCRNSGIVLAKQDGGGVEFLDCRSIIGLGVVAFAEIVVPVSKIAILLSDPLKLSDGKVKAAFPHKRPGGHNRRNADRIRRGKLLGPPAFTVSFSTAALPQE